VARYLRLYACFLRFSFSRATQFRVDFFFRILMDTLWYGHYLAFFALLQVQSPLVGGWDAGQMRVFAGSLFVLDALQMTFVANNLWTFPMLVNHGDLDYHLVRPVSALFLVGFREIAVSSFINLLMAIGVLVWALSRYPGPLPVGSILLYVSLLLVGLGIHFSLHILSVVPVFWTQSTRALRDVFFSLDQYTARPVGVFTGWARRVLTTVLPLGLIVSFPCRILFEGPSVGVPLHMLAALVGSFGLLLVCWSRGLRAYGSASS
jgi:ABC-2 type transport system permease protein